MNAVLKDKFLIYSRVLPAISGLQRFWRLRPRPRPSMCLNIKKHQISCLSFSFNKKKINIFSAPQSFRSCKSSIFFIS